MKWLHILFHWHQPDWRVYSTDRYGFDDIYCRNCNCMKELLGYTCQHRPGECGDGYKA